MEFWQQQNITLLNHRYDVYWDDFSKVDATIKLLDAALDSSPEPDYVVLLSASDYPLRSPEYIEDFFSRNQGCQFINLVRMPCDEIGKPIERLENYWLQTPYNSRYVIRAFQRLNKLNGQFKLIRRDYKAVFNGLLPYGGSTWWALTAEACRYILSFAQMKSRPP